MILLEENQVADADLPVAELRQHLRMGTGFAEDTLQDPVLGSFLRAAMSAIEGRTSKALISRGFVLKIGTWRTRDGQPLPVAPVTRVTSVTAVDANGNATVLEPATYRLEESAVEPVLRPRSASLPLISSQNQIEIRFEAGFGETFADVPQDLRQAVMLLAAHYYEFRDETSLSQGCMPFGVTSLIARYMPVRLGLTR